ncbi:MAG TPA: response regulator [Cyclobacteriaceae bacterium]
MKTILVVEDHSTVRQLLCNALQSKGYQTLGAASFLEAYEMLWYYASDINLVLSDVDVDDIHGFDLLKTIKSNPSFSAIPVALWTNNNRPAKRGAKSASRKTFKSEKFFKEIDRAMSVKGSMVNLVS